MGKTIKYLLASLIAIAALFFSGALQERNRDEVLVAIANYGPHPSLQKTIDGLQGGLSKLGYVEGKNIKYKIMDVNFETSLISQMISTLKSAKPDVIVALSTPVAQSAKKQVKSTPLVFVNVTDPVEANIINSASHGNITGASDKQDVQLMLQFAKKIMPGVSNIGVLYSTAEANDAALVKMLKEAALKEGFKVIAVPLEHSRDAAVRMKFLKGKVDFLYTGSSALVQSALPAIINLSEAMQIPLINFNHDEVIERRVFASYGVSHEKIGMNAASIVDQILKGASPRDIDVVYPSADDHQGYISLLRAQKIKFEMPANLSDVIIVD